MWELGATKMVAYCPERDPIKVTFLRASDEKLLPTLQIIIIIIIMLGCITCCALHAGLRCAQVLLALHASPLRPADLLRLCSARFFFDAGFAHNVRLINISDPKGDLFEL